MQTTACTTAVGVFSDPAQANSAIVALRNAGFTSDQFGVVTRDDRVTKVTSTSEAESAGEGAAVGAIAGAGRQHGHAGPLITDD